MRTERGLSEESAPAVQALPGGGRASLLIQEPLPVLEVAEDLIEDVVAVA